MDSEVADLRIHGTTVEVSLARFCREEAQAVKPSAGIPPFRTARELIRRVGCDCTVGGAEPHPAHEA